MKSYELCKLEEISKRLNPEKINKISKALQDFNHVNKLINEGKLNYNKKTYDEFMRNNKTERF